MTAPIIREGDREYSAQEFMEKVFDSLAARNTARGDHVTDPFGQPDRATVVKADAPLVGIIYRTGQPPFSVTLDFPPAFSEADKDRAWEVLRAIYDEVEERRPRAGDDG